MPVEIDEDGNQVGQVRSDQAAPGGPKNRPSLNVLTEPEPYST